MSELLQLLLESVYGHIRWLLMQPSTYSGPILFSNEISSKIFITRTIFASLFTGGADAYRRS